MNRQTPTEQFSSLDGLPHNPREAAIQDLTDTMIVSITEKSRRCSGAEVMSASFTLSLRMIKAGLEMGVNPEQYRPAIEQLWALLPPVKVDG